MLFRDYGSSLIRSAPGQPSTVRDLSFSSESAQVLRHDPELGLVPEILLHDEEAADFRPLLEAGSVLRNHDPNQLVAAPVAAYIDLRARVGRARIRFARTSKSEECFREVKDGILRGVSFGYDLTRALRIGRGEKQDVNGRSFAGPCVLGTSWRVFELTLTSIPNDSSVGIGRAVSPLKHRERESTPEIRAACDRARIEERIRQSEINALILDAKRQGLDRRQARLLFEELAGSDAELDAVAAKINGALASLGLPGL